VTERQNPLLAPLMPPPSLDAEIKRLIGLHGKEAFQDAAARVAKTRVRDKQLNADFRALRPYIEEEARLFLDGNTRTAHPKIAASVADGNPGHSREADIRRILRRLASPEWKFRVMLMAYHLGETEYSIAAFIKVCRAAQNVPEMAKLAKLSLENMRSDANRLSHRIGEIPLTMTRTQLADEAKLSTLGMVVKLESEMLSQPAPGVTNAAFRDMSPIVENKSKDRRQKLR